VTVHDVNEIERLKRINAALIGRVERSMDQQGNAFSLFQTAINLENRIKSRTEELNAAMRSLEQTNLDLIDARDAAERANISKTRFLAAASHDVLQPLNAAHLSISALADLQDSQQGKKLALQVERSLTTMEELLRTLLDISKLDAGVVKPQLSEVPLGQLFQSLKSDFQPLADKKRLRLRFRPTTLAATTDPTLLRRTLQNIISNSLRYTQNGGILVSVRRRGSTDRIEIWDTGCGIPEDKAEKVFEEFYRGVAVHDGGLSGHGLGLGLAIVQRMGETLGYGIGFRSKVNRGTVFHIDMPPGTLASAAPEPVAGEVDEPRGYGLFGARVLLVENDPAVTAAMEAMLQSWKCEVRSASTLTQTMDYLNDTAWIPDIVIADQHLDDGELGVSIIHAVREHLMRPVPALMVTADPDIAIAKAAKTSGIELMRKPVKPAQMRALLAHLLA
jgi:signal transduction histidine kinase